MAEPTPPPDNIVEQYNPIIQVKEGLVEYGTSIQPAALRNLVIDDLLLLRDKLVQFENVWAHGFKAGYVQGQIDAEAP